MMRIFIYTLAFALGIILLPQLSIAQSQCDAYFPLDGNLADSSGSGIVGTMIGKEGALATPEFVDGKVGRALRLDGTSAMRAFVDLNYETCSQVTMTAWVMFEPDRPKGTVNIISTGGGSGPGLASSGSTLFLKGTANGLMQSNAIRENAGWMFVAGVYDYAGDQYTLYWRGRSESRPLGPNRRVPEEAIWIGALNDGLSSAASGVVVDELRIYGRLLTEQELSGMQALRVPEFESAPPAQQTALASCASQADCGAGSYCAFDRTCHPESHLPMQQIEMTVLPAPVQTITTVNSGGRGSSSGSGIPMAVPGVSGALPANNGIDTGSIEARAAESRPPEIGYASEEEALAAAERREAEAAAAAAASEPQPSGPYATGNPAFTALVGQSRGSQRRIDLESEFLNRIKATKIGNIVCKIQANDQILDLCQGKAGAQSSIEVQLEGSVIGRIEACSLGSIQGMRVWGNVVDDDGSIRYEPSADSDEFSECGSMPDSIDIETWSSSVLCPVDYVGTGIVVHSWDSGESEMIGGLQLICRRVGVR